MEPPTLSRMVYSLSVETKQGEIEILCLSYDYAIVTKENLSENAAEQVIKPDGELACLS